MKDNEKLHQIQKESKEQKEKTPLVQKGKEEKFNFYKLTTVGFFEHLVGFILMVFVMTVCGFLLFLAAELLMLLKGLEPIWRNPDEFLQKFASNWIWIFVVGTTIPGFIVGVSLQKVVSKSDKDKSVKFGFVPLLLGSLLFPGLLALLCISSLEPALFHFNSWYSILGDILLGIAIGAVLWWRVVSEKLNIKSSRSWQ
jgi:hypothetical protein